jgi:UDP-N-acetylmuramate--alanine ligase
MKTPSDIYFLGIGGIGMSALARYFNHLGSRVSGYDRTRSALTEKMESEGMSIHYIDDPTQIPEELDLVVYTPAIPVSMHEFEFLVSSGIPMKKRSQVLGEITSAHKNVAVAGTHGKTTGSILLSHILDHCGSSFTAFLGGISKEHHSNLIQKGDAWMVEEADEFDRSFLRLTPDIAIIGSLDADHLDIYGSREEMIRSYLDFVSRIREKGLLIIFGGIHKELLDRFRRQVHPGVRFITYGSTEASDVVVSNIRTREGLMTFDYRDEQGRSFMDLKLNLPGDHNAWNAAAAIRAACEVLSSEGKRFNALPESLASFQGIERRFEWKFKGKSQVLIEDYAHHPEELRAVIQAARSCFPGRKITGIFQPHLYSRTQDFAEEFAAVLDLLDRVILVELYPARELPIEGISSHTILDKMKLEDRHFVLKSDLVRFLSQLEKDVILSLGAGDLDLLSEEIIKILD